MRRTAPSSTRGAPAALLILAAAACARPAPAPAPAGDAAAEIVAMLHASAEAWNAGDLDAFLSDYAEDASFVTSRGLVHGREAVRELYQRAYWSAGGPEDALRYEGLDVRRVGPGSALAFGRFVLYDRTSGVTTSTGTFSLTLRQAGGRWEIVHDHSAADDPA